MIETDDGKDSTTKHLSNAQLEKKLKGTVTIHRKEQFLLKALIEISEISLRIQHFKKVMLIE